jgi:hypothetical protein
LAFRRARAAFAAAARADAFIPDSAASRLRIRSAAADVGEDFPPIMEGEVIVLKFGMMMMDNIHYSPLTRRAGREGRSSSMVGRLSSLWPL